MTVIIEGQRRDQLLADRRSATLGFNAWIGAGGLMRTAALTLSECRIVASPAIGDRLLLCELGGPSRSLSTGRRVNTRHSLGLECEAINGG